MGPPDGYSENQIFINNLPLCVVNIKTQVFSILLNIMFHAPMGRFQLELPFSPSSHSIVVFFPIGLSSLLRHFQQVLLGVEVSSVSWLGQLTVNYPNQGTQETSTPNKTCWKCHDNDKRPKGNNTAIEWDNGGKIGNQNK